MCNLQQTKNSYLEEYKSAILLAMLNSCSQLEQIYQTKCLTSQPAIQQTLRKELMSWIVEVSNHLGVTPKHTQSVITLIDVVLCSESVETDNYQLLGITCFHMVSKYLGEAEQVKITDYLAATSHVYSVKDVLRLELHLAGKYLLVFSKSFSALDIQLLLLSELKLKKEEEESVLVFVNKLMTLYFLKVSPLKCTVLAAAAALIVYLELSQQDKAVSKMLLLTFMLSRETQAEIMLKLGELRNEMAECAGQLAQSESGKLAAVALKKVALEHYLGAHMGHFQHKGDQCLDMSL